MMRFLLLFPPRICYPCQDDVSRVAKGLSLLSKQKSYIQEVCAVGLSLLIKDATEEVVLSSVLPALEANEGWPKCSPELLFLMLCLQKRFYKVRK